MVESSGHRSDHLRVDLAEAFLGALECEYVLADLSQTRPGLEPWGFGV